MFRRLSTVWLTLLLIVLATAQGSSSVAATSEVKTVASCLGRQHWPATVEDVDPGETPEAMWLYREGRCLMAEGRLEEALAVFSQAVTLQPDSRHGHEGLAVALWQRYVETQSEADLQVSAEQWVRAAEIGMDWGKVRYTHRLAQTLGQLRDAKTLDRLFQRALEIEPMGYVIHVDYAEGLRLLDDPRAEDWYKKAVELQPEGNINAVAYYGEWLLDHRREIEVLTLIAPDAHKEYLHFLRGVALERSGRIDEAKQEYAQYIGFSATFPAPVQYRIEGSEAQTGITFETDSRAGILIRPSRGCHV